MYGHIARGLVRSGAAGTTATVALTMTSASYCAFTIQDSTGAWTTQALPRIYCSGKAANLCTFTCDTAAGGPNFDALIVEPFSAIDVGPVVTGNTRNTTTQRYNPQYTGTPNALRSLHTAVTFTVALGQPGVDVIVTHRLNTANTAVFVSPTSDPVDSGAVGDLVKVFRSASAADTVTLRMVLASAGNFVGNTTVTFDVMVLARRSLYTSMYVNGPHLTALGVAGDDYAAGDRAVAGVVGHQHHEVLYTNVDGIVAGGVVLTHNMLDAGDSMALVGFTETPGVGVPIIANNATSTTTMTLAREGGDIANAYVYFVRPYSMFIPTSS